MSFFFHHLSPAIESSLAGRVLQAAPKRKKKKTHGITKNTTKQLFHVVVFTRNHNNGLEVPPTPPPIILCIAAAVNADMGNCCPDERFQSGIFFIYICTYVYTYSWAVVVLH